MAIIVNERFDRTTTVEWIMNGELVTSDVPEPVWLLENGIDYGDPYGVVDGRTMFRWKLDETLMSRYTNSTTDPEPENDVVIEIGLYEFDFAYFDLRLEIDGGPDAFAGIDFDNYYGSGEVQSGTVNGIDYRIESEDIGSGYRNDILTDHYHEIKLTIPSSFFAGQAFFQLDFYNPDDWSTDDASWGVSYITMYEDNPVVPQYVLTDWASDFVDTRITTLDYTEGLGSLWNDYLQELEQVVNVTDQMISESAAYNFYDEDGTQGYTTAHLEDQLVDGIGGVFDTFATGTGGGDSFDHFAEELWKATELQDSEDSVTASLSSVQAFATMAAGVAEVAALGPAAGAVEILAANLTLDAGVLLVINDTIGKIIDSNPEDPNFVPDDLVATVTDSLAGMEDIYHEALGTLDLYGEDGLADDLQAKYQAFADELSDFTKELTVMAVIDDLFRDKESGFFGGETFERHGEWKAGYQYSAPGGDYGIPEVEVFEGLGLDVNVGYSGSGTHAKITVTETAETQLSGISGFEYDAIVQFYGTPPNWIESEDFAIIA